MGETQVGTQESFPLPSSAHHLPDINNAGQLSLGSGQWEMGTWQERCTSSLLLVCCTRRWLMA